MDRLSVVREKKKRYGITNLSKEEHLRMRLRTEDRLTIAQAKENLWKRFREEDKKKEMEDEEIRAWEEVQRLVMELEEEGSWRDGEKPIREIEIRKERFHLGGKLSGGEERGKEVIRKQAVATGVKKVSVKPVGGRVNLNLKETNVTELERVTKMILKEGGELKYVRMVRGSAKKARGSWSRMVSGWDLVQ